MRGGQGRQKAVFKNLISGLVNHGQIKTTEARAKSIRGLIDRLVRQAKEGGIQARRQVFAFFQDKKLVNKLVDGIAPKFADRPSGFTRIIKLGKRAGDQARMVKMEFLEFTEAPKRLPRKARKKTETPQDKSRK